MRKRQKLGEGYIWFLPTQGSAFDSVRLYKEPNGRGSAVTIQTRGLGAWQKVKLYAEYEVRKEGKR